MRNPTIKAIYNLFALDRTIATRDIVFWNRLDKLVGGTIAVESLAEEYERKHWTYAKFFYRIHGKDFTVDAFVCNTRYEWWRVIGIEGKTPCPI